MLSQSTGAEIIAQDVDPLLNTRQFKEQIPVSDATIWRWEKKGLIAFVRIGKNKFIRQSLVTALKTDGRAA